MPANLTEGKRRRRKKHQDAPDWLGCGRIITNESWEGFLKARAEYYRTHPDNPQPPNAVNMEGMEKR